MVAFLNMQYVIYIIGWLLAAITIVAWVRKAADNTCPNCLGNGLIFELDGSFAKCSTCKGEGKI